MTDNEKIIGIAIVWTLVGMVLGFLLSKYIHPIVERKKDDKKEIKHGENNK